MARTLRQSRALRSLLAWWPTRRVACGGRTARRHRVGCGRAAPLLILLGAVLLFAVLVVDVRLAPKLDEKFAAQQAGERPRSRHYCERRGAWSAALPLPGGVALLRGSTERAALRDLVRASALLCGALPECFLDAGTLLGAWRTEQPVPDDDDADFTMTADSLHELTERHARGEFNATLEEHGVELWLGRGSVDIVARVLHCATGLYADVFLTFYASRGADPDMRRIDSTVTRARSRCFWETVFPKCDGDDLTAPQWNCPPPGERFQETMAYRRGMAARAALADGHLPGPLNPMGPFGVVHGMWSHAFDLCYGCLRRPRDRRRVIMVPAEWIFPVRDCTIAGVKTHCPQDTPRYLEYRYGPGWKQPTYHWDRALAWYVPLAGAGVSWAAAAAWLVHRHRNVAASRAADD